MKNISIVLAMISFLLSCKQEVKEEKTMEDGLITVTSQQFEASKMEISAPVEQDFDLVVQASGKIDVPPQYKAKISPFVGGYVKSTALLIGDKVIKGQALITLENTEYLDLQKDYVEVAEQINYLKSEYERQKTLFEEKITSQKNYLKAESDYRQAKGMYQGLREKLLLLNINPANVERGKFTSLITLTSPITGDVTKMNANVGMYMSPSDVMMEVVNTEHLLLNLTIFESDILTIQQGQKIRFSIPQASKEQFYSTVQTVGKSIENEDRSISVYGTLQKELKEKLLSGMFVEAKIVTATKKGWSVPKDAIIKEDNKYFVLLGHQNQDHYLFRKTLIEIGEVTENFTEIKLNQNVNQNSKILTKGVYELTN
jgi:cobalt-zinc-cadmium efflux system membrane fusion protein